MKSIEVTGEIAEYQGRKDWKDAQGNPISFPIKYKTTADQFENLAEYQASDKKLSDNQAMAVVNKQFVTAAKAAEYQKQVAELKKQWENSTEFKRKELYESALRVFGDTEKGRKKANEYADAAMAQADSE